MTGVGLVILVVLGMVVAYARRTTTAPRRLSAPREAGFIAHQRSGDYPSFCTWCKNTGLARKLFVFYRLRGQWMARDVIAELATCDASVVSGLVAALVTDQPLLRRLCSEKCTKEFLAAEHLPAADVFSACDYCSVRAPVGLARCPNCNAAR